MRRANSFTLLRFLLVHVALSERVRFVVGLLSGVLLLSLIAPPALASGPRFVSGAGIWISAGQAETWSTSQLLYFTDPGSLAAGVSHAQADAMVAAAAAVWNVPTSSLMLAQGGQLAEHVSTANTYLGSTGVVFPADVQPGNEAVMPVAVIYDVDGSLTDLLLGAGASNPVACRQNGVTESVDDVQQDGHIHHALLLLNGRCVGTAPEQMTQMQYQLTRAFGRVLGLAWSQLNDNVFTAATAVTLDQENYWPVMHPLDVLCGPYTYQCMQNPFTLRADDLSSLSELYPVSSSNLTKGKRLSSTDTVYAWGVLSFPSGQGMDWVNVTARRQHAGVMETWEVVSATTGFGYQEALANPVTQVQASPAGSPDGGLEGYYQFQAVPIDGLSDLYFTTEPINPLYTGAYALAPYVRPAVTPSGSPQTTVDESAIGTSFGDPTLTAGDGALPGSDASQGTEASPAAPDASGFVPGVLGGWGQSSWWGIAVRAHRTWTLEATATDEAGSASVNKALPIVGVWRGADALGILPTVAAQGVAFNSLVFGMTQLHVSGQSTDTAVRFVVGDQFGVGRPDFSYKLRILYADTVSPTTVGQGGGIVTVLGSGFQAGNVVRVNGAAAVVQSLSATQIVVLVPSRAAVGASFNKAVTVTVSDLATGGSTAMTGALTYTNGADLLQLVSAPASLGSGSLAAVPFAVQVLAADGVTPLAGATVSLGVTTGTAQLTVCGTAPNCWVTSDSNGRVQSTVLGVAAGTALLSATEISGGASVGVTLTDADPVRTAAFSAATAYVAAGGTGGSWTLQLRATQSGTAATGVPVVWSAGAGLSLADAGAATGADGVATVMVNVGSITAGATTVTGCVWGKVCATWTLNSVDSSQWQVTLVNGAGQSVPQGTSLVPVGVQVTDAAGHALGGAPLTVFQRVLGWEGLCPASGACSASPVLSSSQTAVASDSGGAVSVQPLQVSGLPQTLQIAFSWGSGGFLTCTLITLPSASAGY